MSPVEEWFPLSLLAPQILITIFSLSIMSLRFVLARKKAGNVKKAQPPVAAGSWPLLGHLHLLGGPELPHRVLARMADKYGPIFTIRLGIRRAVVVNTWELAKECLTTHDRAFATRPRSVASEVMGYNNAMLAISFYGSFWREVRKISIVELLSNHRIELLRHIRESEVLASIRGLYEQCQMKETKPVPVDMTRWFWEITVNMMFMMIVGRRFNSDDEVDVKWMLSVRDFFNLMGRFTVSDGLPFLRWLDLGGHEKAMKRISKEMDQLLRGWLDEHKLRRKLREQAGEANREQDFMDVMLSILKDREDFHSYDPDTVNKATCMVMVLAASDTTNVFFWFAPRSIPGLAEAHLETNLRSGRDPWENSRRPSQLGIRSLDHPFGGLVREPLGQPQVGDTTNVTMTWALSLLLNHKEALKKVRQELDTQVGKDRRVKESDLKNLPYLQAVIKETLRLCPAAPLGLQHEAMEDCIVSGYFIPKGTKLIFNQFKIHRDPRVWPDTSEFRPERFLTTHKDVDVKGQNFELIPFGSGRRMCPGVSLALQVLGLTLGSLLHAFEITTPGDEAVDMKEAFGLTNLKASPLEVLITPRIPHHIYE